MFTGRSGSGVSRLALHIIDAREPHMSPGAGGREKRGARVSARIKRADRDYKRERAREKWVAFFSGPERKHGISRIIIRQ